MLCNRPLLAQACITVVPIEGTCRALVLLFIEVAVQGLGMWVTWVFILLDGSRKFFAFDGNGQICLKRGFSIG